jgi:hypothetical protein
VVVIFIVAIFSKMAFPIEVAQSKPLWIGAIILVSLWVIPNAHLKYLYNHQYKQESKE